MNFQLTVFQNQPFLFVHLRRCYRNIIIFLLMVSPLLAHAGSIELKLPIVNEVDNLVIQRRQVEQQAAQLERITRVVNVNTVAKDSPSLEGLSVNDQQNLNHHFVLPQGVETPCFEINQITWQGVKVIEALERESEVLIGRCIGVATLRKFQYFLGERLIEAGFVTSRALIPEQSLAKGQLTIQVLAGVVADTVVEQPELTPLIGLLGAAMPSRKNNLLNQRDLDQTLENVRRLPSQDGFSIDIMPGKGLGESILLLKSPVKPKRWHGSLSVDNSGSESTGNLYQLGGSLSYDSPFGVYDSLNFNFGSNSNIRVGDKNNRSQGLQWSAPLGYALFNIGYSRNTYKQTVLGYDLNNPIVYSGRSKVIDIGMSYVLRRDSNTKDSISLKLNRKQSFTFLNDALIDVQYKDAVGFDASYSHRHNIKQTVVDGTVGVRGLIPKLSKNYGFIQGLPDWNGNSMSAYINLNVNAPFKWGKGNFQHSKLSMQYKWQRAYKPIPYNDFFSIGGRYSVRGGDELIMMGENGYSLRSELSWRIPNSQFDLYVGYDRGAVSGVSTEGLAQRHISGAGIGIKGKVFGLNVDVSYNIPLKTLVSHQKHHQIYAQIIYDF
jgi:hemolysin activation/secretion protein